MKEYVCSVCGYVHKGDLPENFVCPVCGAGREAFILKEDTPAKKEINKTHFDKELSSMEMSVICSNLARGCEKQYLNEQAESFKLLAEFFKTSSKKEESGNIDDILKLIENDLSNGYPYANKEANDYFDRGAKRALLWSEKVTRMLQSLLNKYKTDGDKMLENTGVYYCTICGFVYVGNEPPVLCPVCKVPSWKFEKVERRAK